MPLVLLWALHFQHVGVGGLSLCIHVQTKWIKITTVNKETNPPGETATLRFMRGCVVCLLGFEYVSNTNPWLTVQSAPSSIIGSTVYRKKTSRKSVCFFCGTISDRLHPQSNPDMSRLWKLTFSICSLNPNLVKNVFNLFKWFRLIIHGKSDKIISFP